MLCNVTNTKYHVTLVGCYSTRQCSAFVCMFLPELQLQDELWLKSVAGRLASYKVVQISKYLGTFIIHFVLLFPSNLTHLIFFKCYCIIPCLGSTMVSENNRKYFCKNHWYCSFG